MYGIKVTQGTKRTWVRTPDTLGVRAFTTKLDAEINLPKLISKNIKNARIAKIR